MRLDSIFGIDLLSLYFPKYFIDLREIAKRQNRNCDHYKNHLGQRQMAIVPPDEDIVTMAANAAFPLMSHVDSNSIKMVLFATETSIDQSKAAGIYVRRLLGLSQACRVVELKQACYSATMAIQLSLPYIACNPEHKILVIASDIARYGIGSPGEPTQGGGAVAMIISSNPRILRLDQDAGIYTEDAMDFWRPNYRDEAIVDGKKSIKLYLKSLIEAWEDYKGKTGRKLNDFNRFCYHLPFSKLAESAHRKLYEHENIEINSRIVQDEISATLEYGKLVGNSYTASLYVGLASLLDCSNDRLDGNSVALFSYGSGCMAEFFKGDISDGYRQWILKDYHQELLSNRRELSYKEYTEFYNYKLPIDGGNCETPRTMTGPFRLSGIRRHSRVYEPR